MVPELHRQIISAERMRGDLLITFDDGECALFSAALLYAMLPSAQKVLETNDEEEP